MGVAIKAYRASKITAIKDLYFLSLINFGFCNVVAKIVILVNVAKQNYERHKYTFTTGAKPFYNKAVLAYLMLG